MRKILVIIILFLLFTAAVYAAVPHLINYQGRLTDTSGQPLNGSYNLTFRIYDAETAGNMLWEETQNSINIQKGIFSVLLGVVTNLSLAFDKPYFLEIKVGNEVMSPRQQITTAGYAIRAENAEDANTVSNVGVSTTPTANKLLPLDGNGKIPQTAIALKTYDSGWFAVSAHGTYIKTHNLGTTKVLATLYYAADSNGTNMTVITMNVRNDGSSSMQGGQLQDITQNTISVQTGSGAVAVPLSANGTFGSLPASGYYRIVMLALE